MGDVKVWLLDESPDGTYNLFAPNGRHLFNVSLETLEMLGQMFLDEVESADESEDLKEALYE